MGPLASPLRSRRLSRCVCCSRRQNAPLLIMLDSQEHFLICDGAVKPLMLLYLMHARGVTNALVFTKSAESTARLVKLIQAFEKSLSSSSSMDMDVDADNKDQNASGVVINKTAIVAEAYSSDLTGPQRKIILEKFRNTEIGMCVHFSTSSPAGIRD